MAPLILGFVLGDMMEQNLRRALAITDGKLGILFESPITWILWTLSGLVLLAPLAMRRLRARIP
jgi:putative tricarboxylic transport membrane protein